MKCTVLYECKRLNQLGWELSRSSQVKKKMKAQEFKPAAKFTNLSIAVRFWYGMTNWSRYSIVMAECPYFWIVTNREASIMKKQGFELVENI